MEIWIAIGIAALCVGYLVSLYNRLVAGRNEVANSFSQIDVQLQRRYDLIPNLVETAKAYMGHERDTLEAVISARSAAKDAASAARTQPGNALVMQELAGAEAALGSVLGRLFALTESYPELKANQNVSQLHEELASTENRVAYARQAYNDAVMRYNTQRETFPDVLVASGFGFAAASQWVLADQSARTGLKVSF